jgi:hypothetical protein
LHPKYKGLKFLNGAEKWNESWGKAAYINEKSVPRQRGWKFGRASYEKKKLIMGNLDYFEDSSGDEASSAATGTMIRRTKCLSRGLKRFALLKHLICLLSGVNMRKNSHILLS